MEEKKLYCKYCISRRSDGYCTKKKSYVPKKTTATYINIAENCEEFKKK